MAAFSVHPRTESSTRPVAAAERRPPTDFSTGPVAAVEPRPPAWPEPMRWAWGGAAFVVVATLAWFWLISDPGTHVLVLAPFVGLFLVAAATALWTMLAWPLARDAEPPRRTPWPAVVVGAVLVLAVFGTRADASVRARFAANRDELTQLVTAASAPSSDSGDRDNTSNAAVTESAESAGMLGYGHVTLDAVPGGTMVVTGGHPVALGFVHLPDPADAERWDGAAALRPLGDGWYLTV